MEYEASENAFRLGPGSAWRDFYKAAKDLDTTVLGGRVGYVGVGGYTLGGGLSYLANVHGLAADSLLDAQVVLADGSIVWAKDDKDLLFALRGAGHAFGGKHWAFRRQMNIMLIYPFLLSGHRTCSQGLPQTKGCLWRLPHFHPRQIPISL